MRQHRRRTDPRADDTTPAPILSPLNVRRRDHGRVSRDAAEAERRHPRIRRPSTSFEDDEPQTFSATQLVNDPLLAADDEIVTDLGHKLRWAAFLYGLVGVALAWTVAAQLTIGLGPGLGAYAWAAGGTIAVIAIGIWYFAHVAETYRDASAYRASRSARTLRRLDQGRAIMLTEELGRWVAFALAGFLLVVGVVTALLFLVNPIAGPRLIPLAIVPVAAAYVFGFVALSYRLVDRARDAVA